MLKINELARLHLGVKGENLSRTIEIDMSAWAQTYPNATAEILHKRYGDKTKALTGATYDSETMLLSWTPTDYDTYYEGYGVAEIRMVEGEVVKKTKDLIVTAVCPSVIDGSGSVVASDYQAFLNSVIGYKNAAAMAAGAAEVAQDAAEDAAEQAEAVATHGPYIDDETGDWFVWDTEDEEYKDTGIHAQGPKGDPGSIDNVYATGIAMSTTDPTTVKEAMDEKLDEDQGSANAGKFMKVGSDGKLTPDNVPDSSGKADKVNGAISGNFAALNENGNLTDSGHKASDFLTSQDISGKADKDTDAVQGNFAEFDANGNPVDSGKKASDFAAADDLYADKIPMSSSDSTKMSVKMTTMNDSLNHLRRGLVHVAKLTSGNWQLNSGENAAIGEFISVNGYLGHATETIIGGSTNIVENTNWVKEDDAGALNKILGEMPKKTSDLLNDSGFLTAHQDISGKANNDEIGIVVTGNKTAVGITASQGQYVILRNSTITGKPDGLYKAAQAIPADTAIDGTYLTAVPGGLGAEVASLNSKLITENISNPINLASGATSVSSNAYKTGNVVQLVLQATFTSLSNGTNILSSIVDSIKPKMRTIVSVFDYNTGKPLNGTLWITNASIYYYGDSLTNKTIIIVATYLTE